MEKLDKAGLFGELKMVMPKSRGREGTEAKPFIAGNETKVTKIAEPFIAGNKPFVAAEGTAHRGTNTTAIPGSPEKALPFLVGKATVKASVELGSLGQGWMEGFGQ